MKRILFFLFCLIPLVADAQPEVTRQTYTFCTKNGEDWLMDVYTIADTTHTPRPVMIYEHGGAWSAGSRKNAGQEVFNRHLAELGIVSISIDYRLGLIEGNPYGVTNMTDVVRLGTEEFIDATLFVLAHQQEWNIDPTKIMLSGGSAGAINALTLENDLCNGEAYTKRLPEGFDYAGIISHAGCVEVLHDELVWGRKPCPMLLFHGDLNGVSDGALPHGKSIIEVEGMNNHPWAGTLYIDKQLTEMGAPHWTIIERGADHCIAMKCLTENNAETDQFIREFVLEGKDRIRFTEVKDKEPVSMAGVENMVKFAPLYILGFGKYLEEIDWSNLEAPTHTVY